MKEQTLAPKQYRRANRILMLVLSVVYVIFAIIELNNATKSNGMSAAKGMRIALYAINMIAVNILVRVQAEKRSSMIFMAVSVICMYILLVFGNGPGAMIMIFPIIIVFMIYLNSKLILIGTIVGFITCLIRAVMLGSSGDIQTSYQANLIIMGLLICIYGSFRAVTLLITFSKEDKNIIEEKVVQQEQVAAAVSGIVGGLDEEFHKVLEKLKNIDQSMVSVTTAIDNIAGSSESTAQAASHQADMTGQIQTGLENTDETAREARTTTENLHDTIEKGKEFAKELNKQSELVDENTNKISNTVEQLVKKVEKVSSITESILNISSQTNLLALNASIEAARAGEAGKGFAVVADEIRKLAEETRVSTEQITDIIDELTKVTNETKKGIDESAESINVQREKVEQVNASFMEIGVGMQALHTDVNSMSHEVNTVLKANTAIVDSISLLSAASEEVSAGAQESKETCESVYENLKGFSKIIDGAFEQLQELEQTVAKE